MEIRSASAHSESWASVNINETLAPDSTQINADDLIGGPITVTVTNVRAGTTEQPVNIDVAEFPGRAYRPSKTMRRILVAAWGVTTADYIGRRIMIYRDPEITFGKDKVGGIRISALSHIESRLSIALTVTRGRRSTFTVDPLPDAAPKPPAKPTRTLISNAKVTEFEQRIIAAGTAPDLDAILDDLKAYELGAHRDQLKTLWDERRAEIVMDTARDIEGEG